MMVDGRPTVYHVEFPSGIDPTQGRQSFHLLTDPVETAV